MRSGYQTHTAADRQSAVQVATDGPLDLAIVDYVLGGEDGLEVMGDLRQLQPGCLRVLMTGQQDFPMVVEAINRGEIVRVLRKPFQPNQLTSLLREAFQSAQRLEQRATAKLSEKGMAERATLDECLRRRMMRLAVQPIVDVSSGKPIRVAYEALLRPQHPSMRSPLDLLEAAERFGRIDHVGMAVLELAAEWVPRLPETAGLFINLHPIQLANPRQLGSDLEALLPYASRITMEITERARMGDINGWEDSVQLLTQGGFSIAVDDLGAGYNSLAVLADLSPQYIKLDMSLVRNAHLEPRKRRLIQLLATFAEATSAKMIGEGVEVEEEAKVLRDMGVNLLQGYHYARPMLELEQEPVPS